MDEEVLRSATTFNEKLIASKNILTLLVFSYEQRHRCGGPGDDRDSDNHTVKKYFLGRLSGETLSGIVTENTEQLFFPFSRYVKIGDLFAGQLSDSPRFIGQLSATAVLGSHQEPSMHHFFALFWPKKEGRPEPTELQLFIGEEQVRSKLLLLPEQYKKVLVLLDSATEEEKFIADGI